ncbi:MAG TPA: hypothetical protein VGR61_02350 [Candidatus Dormibacteraeota bacterium]|nr:hypothetical protein [Candidatus Dormibacteraeota bacterium]
MTIKIGDPLASNPLARRLDGLAIAVPPFPGIVRAAAVRIPTARGRAVRRTGLAAAAAFGAILATTAAAFPNVVSTIGQDMLRLAGLSSSQVSPAQGEAHHGTSSLSIAGAYSDGVNTVVFATVRLNGVPCERASAADVAAGRCGDTTETGPYLTDQFGQRYETTGGEGVDVGPYAIFFEPVRGRAVTERARLTIHVPVTRYVDVAHRDAFDLAVALSGALSPTAVKTLPAQPPVVDAARGVTYQLVRVQSSGTYLEVHTHLSGTLSNVATRLPSGGNGGVASPGVFLVDAAGAYEIPIASGSGRAIEDAHTQDETRVFALRGPGSYRVVVNQTSNPGALPPGPNSVTLAQWTVAVP